MEISGVPIDFQQRRHFHHFVSHRKGAQKPAWLKQHCNSNLTRQSKLDRIRHYSAVPVSKKHTILLWRYTGTKTNIYFPPLPHYYRKRSIYFKLMSKRVTSNHSCYRSHNCNNAENTVSTCRNDNYNKRREPFYQPLQVFFNKRYLLKHISQMPCKARI